MFSPDAPCAMALRQFFQRDSRTGLYRPIEGAFLACVQARTERGTLPGHIATAGLHVLLSHLVFVVLLTLGYSQLQAIIGSLFMLVSQANAIAVLSNDTLSQVIGTLSGCFSLWMLYVSGSGGPSRAAERPVYGRDRARGLSLLTFAIALISKETGVSFFTPLFTVSFLKHAGEREGGFRLRRALRDSWPYGALLAAYLAGRWLLNVSMPELGPRRNDFSVGSNIAANLALLISASIVPWSSVGTLSAVRNRDLGGCAAIAGASALLLILAAYGLWRSRPPRFTLAVGAMGVCVLFPMAMMNHVSELYAYNCMPFFSVLGDTSPP